ncbi:MAG: dual specificity protein phosphatase family protein [Chloroflexi bacterium]|nr:dual specificity protein phosphatase family protein [Chloroflexota bacterium]
MFTIRPWLHVGKFVETLDVDLLRTHEIGAMLQLAESVQQIGIAARFVHVEDGEPLPKALLREGVDFVRLQKSLGRKVLVACGAGISRSTTFAIAALKEEEGLSVIEAYRELKAKHPLAQPHPTLWTSLCAFYGEEVSYMTLLQNSPSD